jgi:hypothetical protein
MYPFYLGIDLHLKRSYVVLINTDGEDSNLQPIGYLLVCP